MNDKEFVLDNVETINADVKNIDELCCSLEHSTIFAIDYIQTFATDLLKLQYENNQLQSNWNSLRELIEDEKTRLAKECSHTYEDSLGKTKLVNEDIFNELNKISKRINELEGKDIK